MTDIDIDAIKDRAEQAEPHARGCGCVTCLSQRDVPALLAEVERLRGGRDICIYCGWSCSRSEAPEALAGHVRSCPEHPMRKVEAKVAAVEAVVEQYGDDYEPEDRWRYTRDLRAALRGDQS
jgi:hypothetical protein